MKLFKYFILIILLSVSLSGNVKEDIHLGLSIYKSDINNQLKIKKVIKKVISEINKEFDEKIYFDIFNDEKTLIKNFEEFKNLNIIIIYPSVYLRNIEKIKKNGKDVTLYGRDAKFIEYLLIANKKSNIKNIKDIKNKRYEVFNDMDTYTIWLDYLTRKKLNITYKKLISKEKHTNKESSTILNVYFNKSDFTVVSKKLFDDMLILNPSLKDELLVIKKSKPIFVNMISFVNINTNKDIENKIDKIFDDIKYHKRFYYLFNIIDKTSFTKKISFKELKGLEDFYSEYRKLKEQ